MNTINTKQAAMNTRRVKSKVVGKTNEIQEPKVTEEIKLHVVDVHVSKKSKGAARIGGAFLAGGLIYGGINHYLYAEKSEKNNKGKLVLKEDYAFEMGLPLIIVLAGAYIMKLGLSFHDVEEKVKMTDEEYKEYLAKKASEVVSK